MIDLKAFHEEIDIILIVLLIYLKIEKSRSKDKDKVRKFCTNRCVFLIYIYMQKMKDLSSLLKIVYPSIESGTEWQTEKRTDERTNRYMPPWSKNRGIKNIIKSRRNIKMPHSLFTNSVCLCKYDNCAGRVKIYFNLKRIRK